MQRIGGVDDGFEHLDHLGALVWADAHSDAPSMADEEVARQIGALLTFLTNRRVRVYAEESPVSLGDDTKMFLSTSTADRSLCGGPFADGLGSQLDDVLAQFSSLPDGDCDAIGSAIELHDAGVQLVSTGNVDVAYAMLVAGVERLSDAYDEYDPEWSDWPNSDRLDKTLAELGIEGQPADRIRGEIIDGLYLKLRQRFATYASTRLPDAFWDQTVIPFLPTAAVSGKSSAFTGFEPLPEQEMSEIVPSDRAELRPRLLRSYDRRSRYVHAGTRVGFGDDAHAWLDGFATDKMALPFAGMRAVLRTLIAEELAERSEPIARERSWRMLHE